MRTVVKLDLKIDKDEALAFLDDYTKFLKKHTNLEPEFWVERHDFSIVPTVPDKDGDLKPTYEYRQALATDVHKRYGDYGTDNVIMLVHEDNFLFKGVWGVAWAYNHYSYSFLLCRWDKDNIVNTFNTFFHEDRHPDDTRILKELGISIEPLIINWIKENGTKADKEYIEANGFDYDRDYVHGNLPSVQYIGKSGYTLSAKNLALFKYIAPYLERAYASRKDKYLRPYNDAQWSVINFLKELIKNFNKQ